MSSLILNIVFGSFLFRKSSAQGLSAAGKQAGLSDPRSSLIRQVFRIWDEMEDPPGAQSNLKAAVLVLIAI